MAFIQHAKIPQNKQFVLLLLFGVHYWSYFYLQMSKAETCLRKTDWHSQPDVSISSFLLILCKNLPETKRIKFPVPVAKHMGPNNPPNSFSPCTFSCCQSWPATKGRTHCILGKHCLQHQFHYCLFFSSQQYWPGPSTLQHLLNEKPQQAAEFTAVLWLSKSTGKPPHWCSQTVASTNAPDTFRACWDLIWP